MHDYDLNGFYLSYQLTQIQNRLKINNYYIEKITTSHIYKHIIKYEINKME